MFETVRYFRNDIVLGILLALLIALGLYGIKTLVDRPGPLEEAQKVHVASSMRWPQTAPGKPWLAKPQYPEDGASNDERGVKAAMGYFIATFNYVGRGGEIEAISEFSLPDCDLCNDEIKYFSSSKLRGTPEETLMDYDFQDYRLIEGIEKAEVKIDAKVYATIYDALDTYQSYERGKLEANDQLKHLEGEDKKGLVQFDLVYKDGRWWVRDIGGTTQRIIDTDLGR